MSRPQKENGVCYLENKYVRVINNNSSTSIKKEKRKNVRVASYNCEEIDDGVNGTYSPLLDALFYGTVVGKMYEDWYNMAPLADTMTFRVHVGTNFSEAMWNGAEFMFGDGDGVDYYPLVSLDIIGHEIGHAGLGEKLSPVLLRAVGRYQRGILGHGRRDSGGLSGRSRLGGGGRYYI